jgi:hypothetical protein
VALLDFISSGTYTTVSLIKYDYSEKEMILEVITYTDSTKAVVLTSNTYDIMLNDDCCRKVKGIISDKPESPEAGDMYLVDDPNPESALAYANGGIMVYRDDMSYTFEFLSSDICIIDESTGDRYMTKENFTRVPCPEDHIVVDQEVWDNICGIGSIDADQSTILSRAYEYLKTLPEFSGVQDG